MADFIPGPDDDLQHAARSVLAHAGERANEVMYHPLANTPHGAFTAPDDVLADFKYQAPSDSRKATRSGKTAQEG